MKTSPWWLLTGMRRKPPGTDGLSWEIRDMIRCGARLADHVTWGWPLCTAIPSYGWSRRVTSHTEPMTSDRGFKHMPAIASTYPGGSVRVYESSAARGPHIWLSATAPTNLNEPASPAHTAPIHLTAEDALRLAEQIQYLVRNHYQRR